MKWQPSIIVDKRRTYDYTVFDTLLLSIHLALRDNDQSYHLALQTDALACDIAFSPVGVGLHLAWSNTLPQQIRKGGG